MEQWSHRGWQEWNTWGVALGMDIQTSSRQCSVGWGEVSAHSQEKPKNGIRPCHFQDAFPSPHFSAQLWFSSPSAVTGWAHVKTEELGWGLSWWNHPLGTHLYLRRLWSSLNHLFLSLFWFVSRGGKHKITWEGAWAGKEKGDKFHQERKPVNICENGNWEGKLLFSFTQMMVLLKNCM